MIGHTKVGRTFAWDVEVIGDPITDKAWTDGKGGIVEDTERITIVNADYSSKIAFSKAQRKDTMRYKVRHCSLTRRQTDLGQVSPVHSRHACALQFRIENANGSDEEWLELVVLGPPGTPMGPLECTDVTASTCKLHWLPPEDDGGVPIQGQIAIESESLGLTLNEVDIDIGIDRVDRYCDALMQGI